MSDYETKRIFAMRLTNLLSTAHETQVELAKAMDVAPSSVSSWCTGDKMPRMDKIERLANHFNVDMNYLLGKPNVLPKRRGAIYIGDKLCKSPIEMKDFSKNLKKLRLKSNFSYKDLSDRTGFSEHVLEQYENESYPQVSEYKLSVLAEALDITIEELLGWEDLSPTIDSPTLPMLEVLSYFGYEIETTEIPPDVLLEHISQEGKLIDDGIPDKTWVRTRKNNKCYQIDINQIYELIDQVNDYAVFLIQKLLSNSPETPHEKNSYRIREHLE